mgnify:CR=1 FL=1
MIFIISFFLYYKIINLFLYGKAHQAFACWLINF